MLACAPAILTVIPFLLCQPPAYKEKLEKPKNSMKESLLDQDKEQENKPEQIGWCKGTLLTFTGLRPLTNLIMGSAANGLWGTFLTISNSTMVNLGYSDKLAGLISLCLIILGTPYASYISYLMNTKKKIDNSLKWFSLMLVLIWVGIAFIKLFYNDDMAIHNNALFTTGLILIFFSMGLVNMSYQGLILNSCCIVNNDISEAITTGNILILNNLWCYFTQE